MSQLIQQKLSQVPKKPGVYLWKDAHNQIIYVGKAKNLNSRMHQYFEGSINSYKTHAMVQKIADFEIFITRNDREALLLERQYIEKYNPEYNILLLDDKRYPYIKVELTAKDLKVEIVRRITKKKVKQQVFYFGPFPVSYGAGVILKLLQREAFYQNGLKIQSNDIEFWKQKYNHLKSIVSFQNKYILDLKEKMLQASANLQFEIALDIKNCLQYLEKIKQDQVIELQEFENVDVFACKFTENTLLATVLFYRHGNLIGKDNISVGMQIDQAETLNNFFLKYYVNKAIPNSIIVNSNLAQFELQADSELPIVYAKTSKQIKAQEICELNLNEFINNEAKFMANSEQKAFENLKLLSAYTNSICTNIVAFDNSNYANTNPVGVAITYTNGIKNKFYYRKFNHQLDQSRMADVEYMRQSALKYFSNLETNLYPDLIIADGSYPQINEIKNVLQELNLDIKIIGLVKNNYHKTSKIIDVNGKLRTIEPQNLKNFLTQIQVEVDRFAKSVFHQNKKISSLEGKLQRIKGLGPSLEDKLLKYFKTYNNIYNATLEELEKVVPKNIAIKIVEKEYLQGD
ncbi:excinuclease ABC subunit UvrC [Mycoplasma simbae]|uniref:excinuclease ABC subunit UvrC n=1 Tax=Mycoplasma simbae TaxID=36744 RepID=UPI0006904CB2|nr:excinuclease ABC subunit UvrC [Mycoplasma simbae]